MNEFWILSSALCVYEKSLRPDEINVGYGSNDLVDMVDQNKLVNVQNVVIHPDFIPPKPNHPIERDANLALLKVATPFKFDDNLQPACLELDHPRKFYKEPLISLGFGVTRVEIDYKFDYKYGNSSRYLKQALQADNTEKSDLCRKKNLDEWICTKGDGSGK